jgi:RNA polymerase sigma-70 factor (ECF subfamily)
LQDIYIKIWHNADRYQANGLSPMTWVITIARNHCIDRLRARRPLAGGIEQVADIPDATPGPEALAILSGERARLAACLGELEANKAIAVRRVYLDGATYADLANYFAVPLNTMRTWLRRSLGNLRDCLSR